MIKLVASDIDGTLVPEGTTSINPEFYEIIRKLKEKGILFVGASGRQYSSMRALLDPVFDDIIFISGKEKTVTRQATIVLTSAAAAGNRFREQTNTISICSPKNSLI